VFDESGMKSDQMAKCESFDSTEITIVERNEKAEPSTNSSSRHKKKSKAHNQKLEIKKLQDELKQASKRKKKTKIAVRRFESIRDGAEDEEKATNQEVKQQWRQEIEKRLNTEQHVFDMKEGMEFLRKEIAVVKEKYLELKGEELNPLIDAVRDLQVEASE
jgi:hypothetical protein